MCVGLCASLHVYAYACVPMVRARERASGVVVVVFVVVVFVVCGRRGSFETQKRLPAHSSYSIAIKQSPVNLPL